MRSGSKAKGRMAAVELLRCAAFESARVSWWVYREMIDRVVVEGQQHYGRKNTSKPQDLLDLALVAGMIATAAAEEAPRAPLYVPLPREWKGQVDKLVHHRRTCDALAIPYVEKRGKVVPDWPSRFGNLRKLPDGMQNHVLDAVAMGLWAESREGRMFLEGLDLQSRTLTVS